MGEYGSSLPAGNSDVWLEKLRQVGKRNFDFLQLCFLILGFIVSVIKVTFRKPSLMPMSWNIFPEKFQSSWFYIEVSFYPCWLLYWMWDTNFVLYFYTWISVLPEPFSVECLFSNVCFCHRCQKSGHRGCVLLLPNPVVCFFHLQVSFI